MEIRKGSESIQKHQGKEYKEEIWLPEGEIELCFSTTDSYPKILSVDFFAASSDIHRVHGKELSNTEQELARAVENLNSVYRNQHFQMTRDQTHRQILENSQTMMKWIGGIKIILIVVLAALQLFIMKRFFKKNDNRYAPV